MTRVWNNPEDAARIGGRIAEARLAAGLSQRQLVAGTGYSSTYVSRLESGDRKASVTFLRAIAPRLNVSVAWLETGENVVELRVTPAEAAKLAAGTVPQSVRRQAKKAAA